MAITTRIFGRSGPLVTQVGLGGEGVLRTYGREPEARAVIEEAAIQGISYFDSAQAYAGSQSYYGAGYQDVSHRRPSIRNAQRLIDWTPTISIEETIAETLDFFLRGCVEGQ